MCEPTTILLVGSALVGAYATYESGQTEERFAKYEEAQGVADAQAEKGDAQVEADRLRKMGAQAAAEANVAMAGSGQHLGSAGAMQINQKITAGANEDAYFALLGGHNRSVKLNTQAKLTGLRGKAAAQGATMSAFGQAIGGTAQGWQAHRASKK